MNQVFRTQTTREGAQMSTRGILAVGLVIGLFIGGHTGRTQPSRANQTPVTGVWAFVSETDTESGRLIRDERTWSGIWAFTARYHALARMEHGRRSLTTAALNALPLEEQVKYYEQLMHISSTAGTYTVDGSTLQRRWMISQSPGIIGQESVGTFAVANDRLTVDLPRRSAESGPAVRVVYRRLEQTVAAAPDSIVGVWGFVSETNAETEKLQSDQDTLDAIWVFTNRYYVVARMTKNRKSLPRAELEKLPPAEKVKYYQQLRRYTSTAGEYTATNGTLRRKWQISNSPDLIGQESVGKYSVEADRLLVELPRRAADGGPTVRLVYRRLE
jgi:hypothetical protein